MAFAWVENGKIRDVAHDVPDHIYAPEVARFYNSVVPDAAANGDAWDGKTLTKPVPPVIVPLPPAAPVITPMQFLLLFTGPERVSIRAARGSDALIADLLAIIEDQRLDEVNLGSKTTTDAVGYLAIKGHINAARIPEILGGKAP